MKAYIAGSIFTEGERMFLEKLDKFCNELGIETFLPHRDVGFSEDRRKVFLLDKAGLDKSDIVIAVIDLNNDIGTAWEIGYGYAKGKRIIALISDARLFDAKKQINIVVSESIEIAHNFEELREKLK